jgi:predicted transcriptional regulator
VALSYARRGRPVFPLKPVGKEPLTKRGHLDATTDESRITAWFNRWPNANIGIPTGKRSGFLVLDVDHPPTLDALEAEHGKLPATRTHATGNGGIHYLFRYPAGAEIRNSAGKLGDGLDVRGEGGYIVVPPSRTARPYEVLDRLPLADPPAWLIEALRESHRDRGGGAGGTTAIIADNDGPAIFEGTRDDTLTRIAGRLHDGTRTLDQLAADLMAINEARCQPPLPERQVLKTARSIHARPPCKPAPATTPEALEVLDQIEAVLWQIRWRGMGELSARDVYVALMIIARRYGTRIPAGVRVSISVRALALAAGVSKPTVIKAVRRLMDAGLIRKDDSDRSGTQAGAFVLLEQRATLYHSPTTEHLRKGEEASGKGLRAPRLRWSAPVFERVGDEMIRTTILRLGKGCGAVIDALERAGGSATVEELADALHKSRTRDLRRRLITRLVSAGVVECSSNTVSLAADWMEALNRERELTGEIAAYQRDMSRYARERDAYRNRRGLRPDRAPSEREMQHRRESYPERRRQYIAAAIARLFAERPEYRTRRTGQITCAIARFIESDFPLGQDGYPKDAEVEALLDGVAA